MEEMVDGQQLEEMVEEEELEVKRAAEGGRGGGEGLKEAVKVGCLRFGDSFSLAEG